MGGTLSRLSTKEPQGRGFLGVPAWKVSGYRLHLHPSFSEERKLGGGWGGGVGGTSGVQGVGVLSQRGQEGEGPPVTGPWSEGHSSDPAHCTMPRKPLFSSHLFSYP